MLVSIRVGWRRVEDVELLKSHSGIGSDNGVRQLARSKKNPNVCVPRTIGTVMLKDYPFLQNILKY